MINLPLVSVVIPCYNHEQFVQESIQSVIDQTYPNIELIIIDDGSKDSSVEKIQQMIPLCEERFTRFEFRSRPNKGLSATLNETIEWCKGDFFSALASDDIMRNEKTDIQVKYMQKEPNLSALFGSVDYINEKNDIKVLKHLKNKEYTFNKIFLNECSFFAATQMMRLSVLKKVGGYDPDILVEDWYMWLKMAENGKVMCISDKLAYYRIHSSNTTRNSRFIYENNLKTLGLYKSHPLYGKAYSRITWVYIAWTGQIDKKASVRMLFDYLSKSPNEIFTKGFLVYCKYFLFNVKGWF